MEARKFRHLVWEFNAVLDTGKYDGITPEEVKSHIRAGTISRFLEVRFSGDLDLSYMEAEDWAELSDEWQRIDNAVDARRKMVGIENRGLCLLLGYALESFQQRTSQE